MDHCTTAGYRYSLLFLLILYVPVLHGQASAAVPLHEGTVIRMQLLPGDADRDLQAKGAASGALLRGERGRHEGSEVQLTLLPAGARTGPDAEGLAEDYLIIDSGKPVTRNWLDPGTIWGFHTILLLDSVDRDDFETFIHRYWSPTRSDALPDSKMIFLKKLSGADRGEFSYIWLIDSEETRDYYFPEAKTPSKMYTEFEQGWDWLNGPDYLGKYLAAPEDELYTDFVVVR